MIRQLIDNERITTTLPKAKSIQSHAEKLVTLARNNQDADEVLAVNARRKATALLGNGSRPLVQKLFDEIGPRYTSRNGGYTRILKLGPRKSDGAEMAIIEFVEE
jgi:large subunit ribosomal protein L17